MDINKLRLLLAVSDAGSLSKAAESMGYTQAGVAYIINKMEEEFQVKLIERSYNGVTLTESGKALLPEFQRMILAYEGFEAAVDARRRDSQVTFHIGSIDSIAKRWLPQAAAEWKDRHKEVFIDIVVCSPYEIKRGIENGALDIGITENIVSHDKLYWKHIGDDPYFGVVRGQRDCDSPLVPSCFEDEMFFVADYTEDRGSVTYLDRKGISIRRASDRISTETIVQLVSEGYGTTIAPATMLMQCNLNRIPEEKMPDIIRLKDGPARQLGVVTKKDFKELEVCQDFIRILVEVIKRDKEWAKIQNALRWDAEFSK